MTRTRRIAYLSIAVLAIISTVFRFFLLTYVLHVMFAPWVYAVSLSLAFVFCVLTWEFLRWVNNRLNHYYPYTRNVLKRIILQSLIGIAYAWIAIEVVYYAANQIIDDRAHAIHLNEPVVVLLGYAVYALSVLVVNAGFIGYYFFEEWKKALVKSERLQRERSEVQFENLKNQLNPHFLFNSLTSLNSLIFENQQLASDFLQQLAKVFRYVLQHKDRELVPLATELAFIENYVSLLHTRFYGSLHVEITVPDEHRNRMIVPVTLQILIENAIKHNIVNEANPLTIRLGTENGYILVQNNLQRKQVIENSNKMGLENMQSLYAFLSPQPLEVIEDAHSFTVRVPLLP